MNKQVLLRTGLMALFLTVAGCASGPGGESIYVPIGGEARPEAPRPPRESGDHRESEQPVWRKSEQPEVEEPEAPVTRSPSYRESGDELPSAALALVREADQRLSQGDTRGAIASLERAQRIAPRSPAIYFKLAEAYVQSQSLGSAEQFTLKGLSLAGNDSRMQRAGWLLLADIRRARGNVAGADQAEARAAAL